MQHGALINLRTGCFPRSAFCNHCWVFEVVGDMQVIIGEIILFCHDGITTVIIGVTLSFWKRSTSCDIVQLENKQIFQMNKPEELSNKENALKLMRKTSRIGRSENEPLFCWQI